MLSIRYWISHLVCPQCFAKYELCTLYVWFESLRRNWVILFLESPSPLKRQFGSCIGRSTLYLFVHCSFWDFLLLRSRSLVNNLLNSNFILDKSTIRMRYVPSILLIHFVSFNRKKRFASTRTFTFRLFCWIFVSQQTNKLWQRRRTIFQTIDRCLQGRIEVSNKGSWKRVYEFYIYILFRSQV